jgi:hypothetical protein
MEHANDLRVLLRFRENRNRKPPKSRLCAIPRHRYVDILLKASFSDNCGIQDVLKQADTGTTDEVAPRK